MQAILQVKALWNELIGPTIRRFEGRVFKTTGDGALVEFSSAVDAVRCAVAIQTEMLSRPATEPVHAAVRYRIGIHLGDVVIEGEGAQVDKSLLELLDSPLTHMVRNAVDHGIETPERREAAGKPRRGTITVAFAEQGRSMTLSVSDDGAGLNLDAIRRKGESIGLIAPGAPLQE